MYVDLSLNFLMLVQQEKSTLGPVDVLVYRGRYGSTQCDALCQVFMVRRVRHRTDPIKNFSA